MALTEGSVKGPVTEARVGLKEPMETRPQGLNSRDAFATLGKGSREGVVSAGATEEGPLGRTQEPGHCQPTVQERGAPGISKQILHLPFLSSAVPPTCQPIGKPETNEQRSCSGLPLALGGWLAGFTNSLPCSLAVHRGQPPGLRTDREV